MIHAGRRKKQRRSLPQSPTLNAMASPSMEVPESKCQGCCLSHEAQVWAGGRGTFNDFMGRIASTYVGHRVGGKF